MLIKKDKKNIKNVLYRLFKLLLYLYHKKII